VNRRAALRALNAIRGLALANWSDFARDAALCGAYRLNLSRGRHLYISDKVTCGRLDCWSTYRDLVKRYQASDRGAYILLDCEDAATAHAGWLASNHYRGVYVGLVVGRQVSHAIVGIEKTPGGPVEVCDPCRWYGMPPTTYDNPLWSKVTC
jgi:hypothetical protein